MTVTAHAQRKVIYLKGHMTPPYFSFLNECPGFKRFNATGAQFAATRVHLDLFRARFPDASIEDADGTLAELERVIAPIVEHQRLTKSRKAPFAHQTRALNKALSRDCYAFFHACGTGKTFTMLHIGAELAARGEIDRMIIVAPKRVAPQTVNEQIPEHFPKGVTYSASLFPTARVARQFANAKLDRVQLLIAVVGYGQLQSEPACKRIVEFVKAGPCAIMVDESHFIKNPTSRRAKHLEAMKPYLKRRYLFTGTPHPQGPIDLFSQFRFLDPNIIGHSSVTSFKNQYCRMGGYEGREIVGYHNLDELTKAISDHCEYVRLEDVMDMPEKTYDIRTIEPTEAQREIYAKLKRDFVIALTQANIAGEEVVRTKMAKTAAAKVSAMAQVSSGFFYEDGEEEGERGPLVVINDDRADYVVEQLIGEEEGDGSKVVVFCRFHGSLDAMARALARYKVNGVEMSGRRTDAENAAALHAFQNDPKVRVFVTTAAAGGTGLNLQQSHRAIFYENSYNSAHRDQAEARIWRAGQRNHCVYTDVIMFPVDKMILSALRQKSDLARDIELSVSLSRLNEISHMI